MVLAPWVTVLFTTKEQVISTADEQSELAAKTTKLKPRHGSVDKFLPKASLWLLVRGKYTRRLAKTLRMAAAHFTCVLLHESITGAHRE